MFRSAAIPNRARKILISIGILGLLAGPAYASLKGLMDDMKATHKQAKAIAGSGFSPAEASKILKDYAAQANLGSKQVSTSAEGQDMKKRFIALAMLADKSASAPLSKAGFAATLNEIDTQCRSCHDYYK